MSILPTGGGRGEGGGQRNGVLSRIIAEALLTKTSSMKQPSSEDSDGAPGDKAVAGKMKQPSNKSAGQQSNQSANRPAHEPNHPPVLVWFKPCVTHGL